MHGEKRPYTKWEGNRGKHGAIIVLVASTDANFLFSEKLPIRIKRESKKRASILPKLV